MVRFARVFILLVSLFLVATIAAQDRCDPPLSVSAFPQSSSAVMLLPQPQIGTSPEKYEVSYRALPNGQPTAFAEYPAGSLGILVDGLQPNTLYGFRVRFICSGERRSAPSDEVEARTDVAECPPAEIDKVFPASTQARIRWAHVEGARSYLIVVTNPLTGEALQDRRPVRPGDGTNLTLDFNRLTPDTSYVVTITTECGVTSSAVPSPPYPFKTLTLQEAPPECFPVLNLAEIQELRTAHTVNLQWKEPDQDPFYDVANGGAVFYHFEQATGGGAFQPRHDRRDRGFADTILRDLKPNTTYRVRSYSFCQRNRDYDTSELSNEVEFATLGCPVPTVTVEETYNSAVVSWTISQPVKETRFLVRHRIADSGSAFTETWTLHGTIAHTITGLIPNTRYEYQVLTECGAERAGTQVREFTTKKCPLVDDATAINRSVTTAKIIWTKRGDTSDLRYRSIGDQNPWQVITGIADGNKAINELKSGTTYQFQVRSVCDGATPEWPEGYGTFDTLDCSEAKPTVTVTRVRPDSALLSWSKPQGVIYSEYRYKKKSAAQWIGPQVHLGNEQTLGDLKACTEYEVEVRNFCTAPGDSNPKSTEWVREEFRTKGCEPCQNPMIRHSKSCSTWIFGKAKPGEGIRFKVRWATQDPVNGNRWRFRVRDCGPDGDSCESQFTFIDGGAPAGAADCGIHTDYYSPKLNFVLYNWYQMQVQYQCSADDSSDWVGDIYEVVLLDEVRVSNVTASSATLRWIPLPDAIGYTISYGAPEGELPNTVSAGAGTDTATISGLAASTTYEAAIVAVMPDGESIPVSQLFTTASGKCSYSISPAHVSIGQASSAAKVTVTASAGCAWTTRTTDPWITVTNGASGTGNGFVSYSVAANSTPEMRSGVITVAGLPFTISQKGTVTDHPVPHIHSISPMTAVVGGSPFALSVSGSNFVNGSLVRVNGSNRATTFQGSTQLTAQIPSTDLTRPFALNITVMNPSPGGGLSNQVSLNVSTATGCVRHAPTVSMTPADQRGYGGQQLTYHVSVTNNDTAQCASTTFDVTPTLPGSGWGQSPASMILTIAPGQSVARDVLIWSAPSAAATAHSIQQTATSSAGHLGSDQATYTVYGLQPPDTCGRAVPLVTITPSEQQGYGGQALTYRVTVTNQDNSQCATRTFDVTPTLPGPDWVHTPASMTFTLAPGASAWRDVVVNSAPTASFMQHTFTETASSAAGDPGRASAIYTVYDLMPPDTCGRANPTVTISPVHQTGMQAQTLSYVVTVTNNDAPTCSASSFAVTPTLPTVASGRGWVHVPQEYFTLFAAPGQSASREINVTSASLAEIGNHTILWSASHTNYHSATGEAIFQVIP